MELNNLVTTIAICLVGGICFWLVCKVIDKRLSKTPYYTTEVFKFGFWESIVWVSLAYFIVDSLLIYLGR